MKKLLAIALLTLLPGCATFQADIAKFQQAFNVITTATVTPADAQVAVSSFEVLEAAATQYFIFCKGSPTVPACAPGTVANPGPLRLAIKYDRQGRAARDQIKAAGKSGALISTTAYELLTSAISNLTAATPVTNFGASK